MLGVRACLLLFLIYTAVAKVEAEIEVKDGTEVESGPEVEKGNESESKLDAETDHENFHCGEENTFYAIPDNCDSFVACQKYVARKFICPNGLHFNTNINWPEYPCTYPAEANCASYIPDTETASQLEGSYEDESKHELEDTSEPTHFASSPSPPVTPPVVTVIHQDDFRCYEENAYYPVSRECKSFIACQKYVARRFVCPGDLQFNPKAKWPKYPCSYPTEVNCTAGIYYPVWDCRYGYGTYPSYNDCGEYIVCNDGRAVVMNCPAGLVFNPKISACDWPESVPTCNPRVFEDFKCPVLYRENYGRYSEKTYTYRYKNSCSLYIACHRGEPRLLGCEAGLSFDVYSGRCISSKAVPNCRDY